MTTNDILKQLIANSNKSHFATKHSVTRDILAKWLNGSRNIKISTLEKIAKNEGYLLILKLQKL